MKFIHVYNEEYFEGLVKNGLLNKDSGFKIQHVFPLKPAMKFNEFAAVGTKLYNLIRENHCPFYVDRIAGGVTYHKYDFDQALIREYTDMLGDWFLGFQLHESASNRRTDWGRILQRMEGAYGPYDAEVLRERSKREYARLPDGTVLYGFSQGSPEEYAKMRYAETVAEYYEEVKQMFETRMAEVGGRILPCDSFLMFTKLQHDLGMHTFMPEVGAQIGQMRLAVALARGVAQTYGKLWGTYYETWINTPNVGPTMPCFNRDPGNEWYLTQETHRDDFTSYGENGGSSRLLQKRIYYYSYMSGAEYMAEEWGLNCSYSSMKTFELSPYGQAKKEFIDDTQKLGKIRAEIPFAVVLPLEYSCIHMIGAGARYAIGEHSDSYMRLPLDDAQKLFYGKTTDVFKLIFERIAPSGNEGHVMTNSRFGDLFDIIYEDAPDEVLARYEYLIDAGTTGRFAAAKADKFKILDGMDTDRLRTELHAIIPEILPCFADSLHWILSRGEDGTRYVSVFNNEGNMRTLEKGDELDQSCSARVKLTFRDAVSADIVKRSTGAVTLEREDDHTYFVRIPPAEFVILRY